MDASGIPQSGSYIKSIINLDMTVIAFLRYK